MTSSEGRKGKGYGKGLACFYGPGGIGLTVFHLMILWHFLQYFPALENLPSCCVIVNTVGLYGILFSGHSAVWVIHSVVL